MCCESQAKSENLFNNTRSCVYCVAFSELCSGKQTTEWLICQLLYSYIFVLLYSYVYAYDHMLATNEA